MSFLLPTVRTSSISWNDVARWLTLVLCTVLQRLPDDTDSPFSSSVTPSHSHSRVWTQQFHKFFHRWAAELQHADRSFRVIDFYFSSFSPIFCYAMFDRLGWLPVPSFSANVMRLRVCRICHVAQLTSNSWCISCCPHLSAKKTKYFVRIVSQDEWKHHLFYDPILKCCPWRRAGVTGGPFSRQRHPLPSNRHHRSNGDCLEGKRENYQVSSVQYWAQQLYTVECRHIWRDLTVLWNGFRLTGPISLCLDSFLANVNVTVARPSACLSSVGNARAPYSGGWNFRQYFYSI